MNMAGPHWGRREEGSGRGVAPLSVLVVGGGGDLGSGPPLASVASMPQPASPAWMPPLASVASMPPPASLAWMLPPQEENAEEAALAAAEALSAAEALNAAPPAEEEHVAPLASLVRVPLAGEQNGVVEGSEVEEEDGAEQEDGAPPAVGMSSADMASRAWVPSPDTKDTFASRRRATEPCRIAPSSSGLRGSAVSEENMAPPTVEEKVAPPTKSTTDEGVAEEVTERPLAPLARVPPAEDGHIPPLSDVENGPPPLASLVGRCILTL
jgi:hypothetical protein